MKKSTVAILILVVGVSAICYVVAKKWNKPNETASPVTKQSNESTRKTRVQSRYY